MEAIAKACPLLHAIHLGVCVGLTDAAICSVTTHCKHLTQLLTYNRKQNFSQGALQAIASNSPNLIRLAVSKGSGQTVEDEVRLLTSCSRLESLMMPFTSPESIKYLPPSLTRLSLWAMNTTDELLVAIGQHCGSLTELDIMNCNPNSRLFSAEVGLTAIAKGCTRLQYLTLHRDAEQVSELTLQRWRKTCPLVEVLNAHGFWEYHILIPTCLRN